MSTYLHPGVYVEEVAGGARPVEAAGTSTTAFVGITDKGPLDKAEYITGFSEYVRKYGGYVNDDSIGRSYLTYSVFHFFQNGGKACYIARVEDGSEFSEVDLFTTQGKKTLTISAKSPGSWANTLKIVISEGTTSSERFNLYALDGDKVVELFEDLSMVDSDDNFVDRIIESSEYIRVDSETLPDNPTYTSTKHSTGEVNLSNVSKINLRIDNFGPYEIDCANGVSNAAATSLSDIARNINKEFEAHTDKAIAKVNGQTITLMSPSTTQDSKIDFLPPADKDATYDIFGLQESSWSQKASNQKLAVAYGLNFTSTPGTYKFKVKVGDKNTVDIDVTINADETGLDAASIINDALVDEYGVDYAIAYSDGEHIILISEHDIKIDRQDSEHSDAVPELFGTGFYSYVHKAQSIDVAAELEGEIPASGLVGDMLLKIDSVPAMYLEFDIGADDASENAKRVADIINKAYQLEAKSKKRIAKSVNEKLIINSSNKGNDAQIVLTSHLGNDVTETIFGSDYKNSSDFIIYAEKQFVAWAKGDKNFTTSPNDQISNVLANKSIRIAAGGEPVQFAIQNMDGTSIPGTTLLRDVFKMLFSQKTKLNYKLLLNPSTASNTVHFFARNFIIKPRLHFSLPLLGGETGEHNASLESDTYDAYTHLFGNPGGIFTGGSKASPEYIYHFDLPDNNPVNTDLLDEEINLRKASALSGGLEIRSNPNRLRDLTTGALANNISGIRLLDTLTDISLLVIPGWEKMDKDVAKTFIDSGTAYCSKIRPAQARPLGDLFFITNTPVDVTTPSAAKTFVRSEITSVSAGGYSSIYYPWIVVNDPIATKSPTIPIPPAGSIAGLYASIDTRRGVWKAPAGTEAGLAGVVKLADQVTDIKQDILNPHSVNVIRRIPGAGIVSWGARTLHTNPEWKYVPVRRTAIMLEVSIYEAIQWAVFEPNDHRLWSALRLNIGSFMNGLFRSGAFQGEKSSDAYFVRCGLDDTMTQGDIDRGQVIVMIGFAPLKPAEFVIIRIQQKAGKEQ